MVVFCHQKETSVCLCTKRLERSVFVFPITFMVCGNPQRRFCIRRNVYIWVSMFCPREAGSLLPRRTLFLDMEEVFSVEVHNVDIDMVLRLCSLWSRCYFFVWHRSNRGPAGTFLYDPLFSSVMSLCHMCAARMYSSNSVALAWRSSICNLTIYLFVSSCLLVDALLLLLWSFPIETSYEM